MCQLTNTIRLIAATFILCPALIYKCSPFTIRLLWRKYRGMLFVDAACNRWSFLCFNKGGWMKWKRTLCCWGLPPYWWASCVNQGYGESFGQIGLIRLHVSGGPSEGWQLPAPQHEMTSCLQVTAAAPAIRLTGPQWRQTILLLISTALNHH